MRLVLCLTAGLLALPAKGAAQNGAADSARSTKAGVYTMEQAARGSELYALQCVSCHTAATHTGPAFVAKWQDRALWELFAYMHSEMPKSDPGSLSDSEYLVLLTYLLKMNGMPPGLEALPGDSLALKKIRIDFKPIDPSNDR